MKRILHFSNKPPYPSLDGGCVAIKHILESLVQSEAFEVHHFTLHTHKHPFSLTHYPSNLQNAIKISHTYVNTKMKPLHALKHLISNSSYNIARFNSIKVRKRLKQLLTITPFDAVLIESIYLLPYLDLFKSFGLKIVVRTHNVEHHIWEGLAINEAKRIKKKYLSVLVKQLKAFELSALQQVDGIITISEEDKRNFIENGVNVPTIVIPPALSSSENSPNYNLNDFYFLGAMDWLPNIEGVNWLQNKVAPLCSPSLSIHIAGKGAQQIETDSNQFIYHGEVPTAKDFIDAHGICLIPLLSGSGVKIKLLENMALGKPIVTTKEGMKGVDVTHGKELLIADTPSAFAKAMNMLHEDKVLRKELGENAKKYIKTHYNSTIITNRLVTFLNTL